MAEQPKTERALRAGELSSAKAEVVAGAIEVAPDSADRLLELAKSAPVAKLREECLRAKASVNGDETHARIRQGAVGDVPDRCRGCVEPPCARSG